MGEDASTPAQEIDQTPGSGPDKTDASADTPTGMPTDTPSDVPSDESSESSSTAITPAPVTAPKPKRRRRIAKRSSRYGKTLRKAVPRDVLAVWSPPNGRADRIAQLAGRMKKGTKIDSPRAFFDATARLMASDLITLPTTGIETQLCGDARLSNFGVVRVPGGRIVCDILDFDQTMRGPWEWDVARLATSLELVGRERGFSKGQRNAIVRGMVRTYRESMRSFALMDTLDTWFYSPEVSPVLLGAKTLTAEPWWNVIPVAKDSEGAEMIKSVLGRYRAALPSEWRWVLGNHVATSIAKRKDGVSEHTWVATLEGARREDVIYVQVGEAFESVLERYVASAPQPNHSHRVAAGQRVLQAVEDSLLGWTKVTDARGVPCCYYVRQLWPAIPLNVDKMSARQLRRFAQACGMTLAHGHARNGDRFAIASYLGKGDLFDESVVQFARRYARQTIQDYRRFTAAKQMA